MPDGKKELEVEPYYKAQGKRLVDTLFDKGFLNDDLSRDGMDAIEDMIGFFMQITSDSAARAAGLTKKFKDRGKGDNDRADAEERLRLICRVAQEDAGKYLEQIRTLTERFREKTQMLKEMDRVIGQHERTIEGQASKMIALEKQIQLMMPSPVATPMDLWHNEVCRFLYKCSQMLSAPAAKEARVLYERSKQIGRGVPWA